ncbi:hypothetical protein WR25_16819 [Diploscapter pachys]|uniref:Uncharacterized protein n=1 Tax=Diploscapter pachys TaxID=2018661 RepID=A0A2A2KMP0_9BILA|nr:hypothetical protein WR25_16819 [Diploscapter pachys]
MPDIDTWIAALLENKLILFTCIGMALITVLVIIYKLRRKLKSLIFCGCIIVAMATPAYAKTEFNRCQQVDCVKPHNLDYEITGFCPQLPSHSIDKISKPKAHTHKAESPNHVDGTSWTNLRQCGASKDGQLLVDDRNRCHWIAQRRIPCTSTLSI